MLSFAEKRALQRVVQSKLVELEKGTLSFQQKRATQRELEDALARLEGTQSSSRSQKFEDLIAGKFNNLAPLDFLKILEEVVAELGGDVEPVKMPTVAYIGKNEEAILESALVRSLSHE